MRNRSANSLSAWRIWFLAAILIGGAAFAVTRYLSAPDAAADFISGSVAGDTAATAGARESSANGLNAAEPAAGDYAGGPILIELFTSQGCSSCPPADRVLSLLRQTGQVDGIPIVILSEHVDYWNRLGWTDPYSQALFGDRQAAYARAINRSNRIYTPQMVVDGREEFVGHNLRRATEAVRRAAGRRRIPLELRLEQKAGAAGLTARVSLDGRRLGSGRPAAAPDMLESLNQSDLLVALTEDGLRDKVRRGENAGHVLRHDGVVRRLQRHPAPATVEDERRVSLSVDSDWNRRNLRVIAWLEDHRSRAVLGAATAAFPSK